MTVAFDYWLLGVEEPFVFEPYHKALRKPFDYYMFGQNYIRPLIDFRNSYVGNLSLFYEIEEKLKQLPRWYMAWLLLKMEHYFIGFPQILILDANSYIPFVRKQS
ncbi:glycerol-3-phosphate acyltransferase, chloroplastic [Gossypium hirsutum]|uniref:Glycerol-3-phosphate acyltransferase, chloroplastic n=1 Tax=Gossypium hirsutum TaxID=3635 RepID=A0ABM3AN08_GOSHI|nr:glycerol-3-phosphate acyltransferase, chloroplastic-like [Gossypium hirsutum]XP_040956229.1 glycerol-3-phosphate acyltransferase, chloroplastic-like [Gossypium hirsutum]XP_040956230.1 glycerol-3-phosphate acyltransferase, chloroplastic-like [Gossypium hirsutum]XP_040956231.1 glycerol-3-phosphate acyltransferase, chloroplastic-like [Gossypium hirsutum]